MSKSSVYMSWKGFRNRKIVHKHHIDNFLRIFLQEFTILKKKLKVKLNQRLKETDWDIRIKYKKKILRKVFNNMNIAPISKCKKKINIKKMMIISVNTKMIKEKSKIFLNKTIVIVNFTKKSKLTIKN